MVIVIAKKALDNKNSILATPQEKKIVSCKYMVDFLSSFTVPVNGFKGSSNRLFSSGNGCIKIQFSTMIG